MIGILYIKTLKKLIPLENSKIFKDELILTVHPKDLYGVMKFLKYNMLCQFNCLTAISGTDYPERENRFEVSYELLSIHHNRRIRVKTFVNEVTPLLSMIPLYPAANWWEREIWDLFGVFFQGHPDLRRILTDYGFQGHPLRKDFPLTGFHEYRYCDSEKRVITEPVELAQEFRYFEYGSPWETLAPKKQGDIV